MRKNLFVLIALLTVSSVCTSAKSNVTGITRNDSWKQQALLLKQDVTQRLKLTPEMITGIKDVKERMQSTTEAEKSALLIQKELQDTRRQLETAEIKNRNLIDNQKLEAAINKARRIQEKPMPAKATRRAPATRPNQWDQPFYANGDNNVLTEVERHYSINGGDFKRYGESTYRYDSIGQNIEYKAKIKNLDNIVNIQNMYSMTIPVNAVVYQIDTYSDTLKQTVEYYIDPATGQRKELTLHKYVYLNGATVSSIEQGVDSTGNMVVNSTIETEYDAQGRPIATIESYWNAVYDKNGDIIKGKDGNDSIVFRPSYKAEYEYVDTLVYAINAYYEQDTLGHMYWLYNTKVAQINDEKGHTTFYESYIFQDTAWVANQKYTYDYEYYDNGNIKYRTYTTWEWDTTVNDWQVATKEFTDGNPRGYINHRDYYAYSKDLSDFYMYRQYGFDWFGDTLRASYWYIYYDEPTNIANIGNLDSTFNSGSKDLYTYYTVQELPWLSKVPDVENLQASFTSCYASIDTLTKQLTWVNSSKVEYEYSLVKPFKSTDYQAVTSLQKTNWWDEDENKWCLTEKYTYDQEGKTTQEVYYGGDVVTDSIVYVYRYDVMHLENGDSLLLRYLTKKEVFRIKNGKLTPDVLQQFDYDKNGYQTLFVNCKWYDNDTKRWTYGDKYEYEFDNDGHQLFFCSYSWNANDSIWLGRQKSINVYNEEGECTKYESFTSYTYDAEFNTIWIPYSLEVDSAIINGDITFEYYIQCNTWDTANDCWQSGYKTEWTKLSNGKTTDQTYYNIVSGTGEWMAVRKQTYTYNNNNDVISDSTYAYNSDSLKLVLLSAKQYTYTQDGDLVSRYDYNGKGVMTQKHLAVMENGNITGYVDSLYYSYEGLWHPYSRVDYFEDKTNLTYTIIDANHNGSDWENDSRKIYTFDTSLDGNVISYELDYWNSDSLKWIGNQKKEIGYDENGEIIMVAVYSWDSQESKWEGSTKVEEQYDSVGYMTLEAEYYWDSEKEDWRGYYKNEYAHDSLGNQTYQANYFWDSQHWRWSGDYKEYKTYDANGKLIFSASYVGMDSLGNWIGKNMSGSYTKDGITYSENYYWDYDKNDWCGNYKSEYASSDTLYLSASYYWNEDEWCWTGYSKSEHNYKSNTDYYYKWDSKQKDWVGSYGSGYEEKPSQTSTDFIYTYYKWENSKWVGDYRSTRTDVWNRDDNLATRTYKYELLSSTPSKNLKQNYSVKYVYNYSVLTTVETVTASATISVADCIIVVNATDDVLINISSAAGIRIASGTGSVTASVVPGIYLITVGNKTTKVLVR